MGIKEITFEEILPFWKQLWWPKVDIQKRSGRLLLFGFDRSIITNDDIKVTYFGAERDGKIVGVNSGYSLREFEYRSRGLYILPEYRKKGIAQELLQATQDKGHEEKTITLWSLPRRTAINAYIKFGFKILSDYSDEEYGQNCFAMKGIK